MHRPTASTMLNPLPPTGGADDACVRLAHMSDIHVTATPLGWSARDWLTKRSTGWFNLRWLGRGRRFRYAEDVVRALVAELRADAPDRVVFSGDATALGFESELARAAEILPVRGPGALSGLAVPGNHDYYLPRVAASGLYERYFAPWQVGERVNGAVYPFAQRVGHLWLVGVNSCTGNRWPWDAAGSVDQEQIERLKRLLHRLGPQPRILVTHYPVCLPDGRPERRTHALRNLATLVRVAAAGGVSLWLHGHVHGTYHLPDPCLPPFPVICAGSATQSGLWGYNRCTVRGLKVHVERRVFDPATGTFRAAQTFDTRLREPFTAAPSGGTAIQPG